MNELWTVRHGKTEWSVAGKHTSTTNLRCCPRGRRSREGCAAGSPTLTSPGPDQPPPPGPAYGGARRLPDAETDDDLAKWAYGDYEGTTTEEIRERDPQWTIWTHPTPGGESAEQVCERLDRVVARVRATEGRTLVFGHGHALRALAARWLGRPVEAGQWFKLDTATLSTLGYEREHPVLQTWNAP